MSDSLSGSSQRASLSHLAEQLCLRSDDIENVAEAKRILASLGRVIEMELFAGNNVSVCGLGSLKPKVNGSREGVHPRTRQPIAIPSRLSVRFHPGAALRRRLSIQP